MNMNVKNIMCFGWSKQTHSLITKKALDSNNHLNAEEKELLASFTVQPDDIKTEKGYHNNTHFYFPYGKTKSFGKEPEENNALKKFIEHYRQAFKTEGRKDFLKEVAYALHFLQDAGTPVHTEESNFLKKIRDFYLHKNFERGEKYGAASRHNQLLAGYQPQKIDFLKLDNLFIDTAKFSAQAKYRVSRFNKSKWANIQQECFNYGVSASKEFIDFMMNFLPKK